MATDKAKGEKVSAEAAVSVQPSITVPELTVQPLNHVPDPKAAALAALAKYRREKAEQSTHDRLMAARRDQLKRPDQSAEIIKGNTLQASVWTYGPGVHVYTVQVDRRFTDIAKAMGIALVNNKVARIHAYFVDGSDILVMFPANPDDHGATVVHRYDNGGIHVNLSDLLIGQGVAVESGYKEFRPVTMIPEGSELWPGLTIDYGLKPKDRRIAVKTKDEDEAAPEDE